MWKKLISISMLFTLVFGTTVHADNNAHSLTERQQTVVLNTSNHMADSDYQIVQLYGTRDNEADTLLFTVTNKINSRVYDEFGEKLPGIVQNDKVTDVVIKCKYDDSYLKTGSTEFIEAISSSSDLHETSPSESNRTELNLTFEINPQSGLWQYETKGSVKKNVYDSYYVVQRDEIHDKRNTVTKSNVSSSLVMLNLSDPDGSAGKFNDKYIDQEVLRSEPIHMLPNFYPKNTSLSEFDQVYWYVTTESSLSANRLCDAYKDIAVSERLASNSKIIDFMNSNHRTWTEVSTDKQLTYSSTETGIDTVYVYCLVHHIETDTWLISNIEKVSYLYDALLYTGTFEEGAGITLELLNSIENAEFIDTTNGIHNIPVSDASNLKITKNDEGKTSGSFTVLPGSHTYFGTMESGGVTYNIVLQLTGTEQLFTATQLKRPNLGDYWINGSTNLFNTTNSEKYFTFKYGSKELSYPGKSSDDIFIKSIRPTLDYVRETNTLVNVTLSVHGVLKQASFIAKANYAGNDTTDTTTTVLSITLTKTSNFTLTSQQVKDNDVSSVLDKLKVTATLYDGTKKPITQDALFNVRQDGRYAVIVASYAQCTSSIAVPLSD